MSPPVNSAWNNALSWLKPASVPYSQAAASPGPNEWTTVARTKPGRHQPKVNERDAAACLEEARRCERKNNEARQQAAGLSARYGDEAASYYLEQAKDHDAEAKEWRSKATKASVKAKQEQSASGDIDLHGCTVPVAREIAQESVNTWWSSTRSAPTMPLPLVVGRGQHSKRNKPAIGPAVMELLESQGWDAEQRDGTIYVHGMADDSRCREVYQVNSIR